MAAPVPPPPPPVAAAPARFAVEIERGETWFDPARLPFAVPEVTMAIRLEPGPTQIEGLHIIGERVER